MFQSDELPQLTKENSQVTSEADVHYNCVAWAAYDTKRWWQPGAFWPVASPADEYGISTLEGLFSALGYEECDDEFLEPSYERVALYGAGFMYTHAARQILDGRWTSKLGKGEDITHNTPDDVAGGLYGEVVQFRRRPVS